MVQLDGEMTPMQLRRALVQLGYFSVSYTRPARELDVPVDSLKSALSGRRRPSQMIRCRVMDYYSVELSEDEDRAREELRTLLVSKGHYRIDIQAAADAFGFSAHTLKEALNGNRRGVPNFVQERILEELDIRANYPHSGLYPDPHPEEEGEPRPPEAA